MNKFDKDSVTFSLREIREKADNFRQKQWPQESIPIDIEIILEKMGFILEPVHNIKRDSDTISCLSPDLKTISIDIETMLDERQAFLLRFSLAHELGHYVLHRPFFEHQKEQNFKTIQQWISFVRDCSSQNILPEYFEQSADEFAGRFLVPQNHLEQESKNILKKTYTKELKSQNQSFLWVKNDFVDGSKYALLFIQCS